MRRPRGFPPAVGLAFLAVLCAFVCAGARADGHDSLSSAASPGFPAFGNLGLFPSAFPTLDYSGWAEPERNPTDVGQQSLTAQIPLYRGDKDSWALSAGATSLHFGEPRFLGGSGIEVPQDLWKAEVGGSYSRNLGDGKLIGGRVSLGSASDHPFADFDVTTVGASAYYSWASSARSRWMLTLFFSNNNPLLNYVPIPGFVYLYQTPTFVGMFGFPFTALTWKPEPPWNFTLSIFGPVINAEIAYGAPARAQLFTGFSWTQQSYLREGRPDPTYRLYYEEKRAPVGVRFPVLDRLRSEVSAGYAFARSVYEGSRLGRDEDGSVGLGSSWFGEWDLKLAL